MAKRERLPEAGSPQIPQGISASIQSAQGRMRGRSMLDTMPLAQALTSVQEESNRRLRMQLESVLVQAGQQAERRRLAEDPDVPPPELTPADQSLFQINAAYHAMYDAGRAQVYGSKLYEEHARILQLKRENPSRSPHLGRAGEALPYDSEFQGEPGFYLNPDGFAAFSRALEKNALDALAEADPSGVTYSLFAQKLADLHVSEREKSELAYDVYTRIKSKEVTDQALAEMKKVQAHAWRQQIKRGPAEAFKHFKNINSDGFKAELEMFVDQMIRANPAIDLHYAGKREQIAREYNDSLMMEVWRGIVDQARTNGQDELLVAMARWLNTDEANILFDKENMAVASEQLESARKARIDEWIQQFERLEDDVTKVGIADPGISNRAGALSSLQELWRKSFALAPGRESAINLDNTGWTQHQLTIDHEARWLDYALRGTQFAFSLDKKGNPEPLELQKVIPGYVPIYERLWTFRDTQSVLAELQTGIPLDTMLNGNLTDGQRAKLEKMKNEGATHFRPMLISGGADKAKHILGAMSDAYRDIYRIPGDAAYASGNNALPAVEKEKASLSLSQIASTAFDPNQVAYNMAAHAEFLTKSAGLVTNEMFGYPVSGLSSRDAKDLIRFIKDAVQAPNAQTPLAITKSEFAQMAVLQTLSGMQRGLEILGKPSNSVPMPYYADPRPWEVMIAQDSSFAPSIRRIQAAVVAGSMLPPEYAKALFDGAILYNNVLEQKLITDAELKNAVDAVLDDDVRDLARTYTGGIDVEPAARGIAEAIVGWSLLSVKNSNTKLEKIAKQQRVELQNNIQGSLLRIDDPWPIVLNLRGSAFSRDVSGELRKRLEIALPAILDDGTLNNVLGTNVSSTLFEQSVPVLQQINGRLYIQFFHYGVPLTLQNSDNQRVELLIDATEIGNTMMDYVGPFPAMRDEETGLFRAERPSTGDWTKFIVIRRPDGTLVRHDQ